ncbi:hypothetical protein OS493_012932 [Desmophyllum pertusum]|uniref:Uncharacterized protein n=1 Tax=Desmophyllum pertusum TaxID=174260 RepID=A0A9W9Z1K5_9CNID|nr:hypothetical protein OS493_012932 [Desmophyllum pertusum]
MACAEVELNESDDLQRWLSTFKHQLDTETFTYIFETLKANQFSTRLTIKLIGEEEFNLMFQKQLSLGAEALLQYQISLLKEQSPLQKPLLRVREERRDTSVENTGPKKNVLRVLEDQEKKLHGQLKIESEELKEVEMRIDSMNILIREPPPVGEAKSICGHCHHRGHRNQALKPCSLKKCTEYTYCGIKERHSEYFSKLTSLKLERKKRKDAVGQLEGQLKSMEQFSTSSEHQFVKSVTPRMFSADESYKQNKPKLMRDVRLLRDCLEGKIPPVTANDAEQIKNLISRCKRLKQIRADDSPEKMEEDKCSPIKYGEVPTSKQGGFLTPVMKKKIETAKTENITRVESSSSSSSSDSRRLPYLPMNSFGSVQSSQTNVQQVITPYQQGSPSVASALENLDTLANVASSNADEHYES